MLQAFVRNVSSVSKHMLQVFYLDVAKVNRHVAYVAMAIHVCFKCMFQMFQQFFRRMLQVFYLNVAVAIYTCCKRMF